jgi:lactate dehydrogenase-like 2-hydroxyacid dehydrogenase
VSKAQRIEVIVIDTLEANALAGLQQSFVVHQLADGKDRPKQLADVGSRVRAIARGGHSPIDADLIGKLPALEIIANFGVGYDGIDLAAAGRRGIIVTNSPDVLTEEVADTALGLLPMTVRELSSA